MSPGQKNSKAPAGRAVKNIRRATRKQYSAEEKIGIVLGGLRGDDSIAEPCRREGIAQGCVLQMVEGLLAGSGWPVTRPVQLTTRR